MAKHKIVDDSKHVRKVTVEFELSEEEIKNMRNWLNDPEALTGQYDGFGPVLDELKKLFNTL